MSAPPAAAIHADGLTKTYRSRAGAVRALDGLGFEAPPGSVFALLGPNGAGKSTTTRILTTLTTADSGTARVAGHDVATDGAAVRRAIGYVPQLQSFDPMGTGVENLVLAGRVHGMSRADAAARATDLLARFGLAGAARRVTRTWSGGMQRKLDVAMALVHRPSVLFLDEPTTGLDPEARVDMWDEIAALARTEGTTVLLTTHYLEEADRLADRVAIVDGGRVVAEGTPEGLKAELEGDAIAVELAEGARAADARAVLGTAPGVGEVTMEGRVLRARVPAGTAGLPAVLGALERAGVAVAAITLSRPSLDDVYLRYAGRSYAAGEVGPRPHADHREPAGVAR